MQTPDDPAVASVVEPMHALAPLKDASGVYDFAEPDYRALMQRWLAALPAEGGLLFCHPGDHADGDPPDAIGVARAREIAYLGSTAFAEDLAAADVRLGRVWQTSGGLSGTSSRG